MNRFLIIKPSSLGDVLHAFPAVSALLRACPGSTADWVIHPAFADLTAYLPGIRNVILFERKKLGCFASFPAAFAELYRKIRADRYDAVIDLQGLTRSALIGRLASAAVHAGPRHPREIWASFCYSRTLPAPDDLHAVERNNAMIAGFLQRTDLDFSWSAPVVERFAGPVREKIAPVIPHGTIPVGIAPGARWTTKQWPPEFFADLIVRMTKKRNDLHFLLLGTAEDADAARRIRAAAPEASFTDLCGKTSVGELVETIRLTSLFLCNDSGPMHIAAALDVPVLAFFGPTSPSLTGPYSKKSCVLQPQMPCILCLKRYCKTEQCHRMIDAETAALRALELLNRNLGNGAGL